jgi:opacity protein-like surface antigen
MGGYFLTKRIAVGLRTDYSHTNLFDSYGKNLSVNTWSVAPFARYYVGVKRFAPFAELSYGGSWYKSKLSPGGESSSNSTLYSAGVGLNYFLSRNVALEGTINYLKTIDSYYDGSFGIDLGLQFFLSRKKSTYTTEEINYFSKGQWLIGGTGNASLSTANDINHNQFSIIPMAGYLIGNKFAVGLSTGFNYQKGYNYDAQSFYAQPFVRYYLNQKRLAPFGEIAYGAALNKKQFYLDNSEVDVNKDTSTGVRISAGLNYFITRNIALEGKLGYSNIPDFDSGTTSFQAGFQFFLK